MTIDEILNLKESEDKVEFKEAKTQYNYKNGKKSVLGYTVAFANERGGLLVFGIRETQPYEIVGSSAWAGQEGKLEENVYRDLGIRIETEVILDQQSGNRVLVIKIPSRPIGKPLYFNDVALMRVGDRLERMSEETYLSIIQEQEPDFSARICPGLMISDLDDDAISLLKQKYSEKQKNEMFSALSHEQVLADLGLSRNGVLTYASLILVGKAEAIRNFLPQAKTIIEFRNNISQIPSDWREEIDEALVTGIDKIWNLIHSRNRMVRIQQGPFIEDLLVFNEEVIREAILNAISHRDYSFTSETVIKQFPNQIEIYRAGCQKA